MIADIERRHSQAAANIPNVINQIFNTGAALPLDEIRECFKKGGLNLKELKQISHEGLRSAVQSAISCTLPIWEGGPLNMEAVLKDIATITAELAFSTMRVAAIPGGAAREAPSSAPILSTPENFPVAA
jgi:hypothetical protein